MSDDGISIFEHWRKLAQAIIEERDEAKRRDLVKQLSHSYQEEMFRLSQTRERN